MGKIIYNGNNKSFIVPKRKKVKPIVRIVLYSFLALLFGMIAAYFLVNQNDIVKDSYLINYNEKASSFYQVYLKDNNQYDDPFLNSGMEYVTGYIDEVRIKYNYEFHATKEIEFEYEYKVTANLKITAKNEPEKTLLTKTFNLDKGNVTINEKDLSFLKDININYDEYNNIVSDYKNTTGVAVDSEIEILMEINTEGNDKVLEEKLNTSVKLNVIIPLGEQTIGIDTPLNSIDNKGQLTNYDDIYVLNYPKLITGIIFSVLSLLTLIILIMFIYRKFFKRDLYTSTIKKYLREYDRLIVSSSQPDLNESAFNNKIRVMSIEELIDAHDSTGSPIIYYEVIPNEKSYFIIIDNLTLYKLTISKKFLEEQKGM